jgi:hypothetical protein
MANPTYILPRVTGPAVVKVNFRTAGTNVWTTLGYTVDGVSPTFQSFDVDVYSDRLGGSQGVPVDKQKMGALAKIPLQLVEFNETALKQLLQFQTAVPNVSAGVATPLTAGRIGNIGCLQSQKGATVQLLVLGAKDEAELADDAGAVTLTPINFPNCFLDEPFEIPVGSKNTIVSLGFTALPFTAWDTANIGSGNTWLYIGGTTLVERLERYAS